VSAFRKSGQKGSYKPHFFLASSTAVTPDTHIRNFCPQAPQHVIESSSQKGHSSCHESRHPGMLNRKLPPHLATGRRREVLLYYALLTKDSGWRSIKRYPVSTIVPRSSQGEILLSPQNYPISSFLTIYFTATIRDRGTSYHMALPPGRLKGARHQGGGVGGLLR
jgi:hypothetical protein